MEHRKEVKVELLHLSALLLALSAYCDVTLSSFKKSLLLTCAVNATFVRTVALEEAALVCQSPHIFETGIFISRIFKDAITLRG